MSGASNLESKYLDGAYLINCDSEDWDKVTMSSAGSVNIDVTGDIPVSYTHLDVYKRQSKNYVNFIIK